MQLSALRSEAHRTVAVIGIAIERVARDHDHLAIHGCSQMRRPAVVPDEQLAPFQHGADLAKRRAAENDRLQQATDAASFSASPSSGPEQMITGCTACCLRS